MARLSITVFTVAALLMAATGCGRSTTDTSADSNPPNSRRTACTEVKQWQFDYSKQVAPLMMGNLSEAQKTRVREATASHVTKLRAIPIPDPEMGRQLTLYADKITTMTEVTMQDNPGDIASQTSSDVVGSEHQLTAMCLAHWMPTLDGRAKATVEDTCRKITAATASDLSRANQLWEALRGNQSTGPANAAVRELSAVWNRLYEAYEKVLAEMPNDIPQLGEFRQAIYQNQTTYMGTAQMLTTDNGIERVRQHLEQQTIRNAQTRQALYCNEKRN